MARIVLADDGIRFDGRSVNDGPLGGVESSVVNLVEEFARRGHQVRVCNNCAAAIRHNDVDWTPIGDGLPDAADLYIANRGDKLINLMPRAGRVAFWLHNPAGYLLKWRYLSKLWTTRPVLVFIGDYHSTTCPGWVPDGGRKVIPYGISGIFCSPGPIDPQPTPRAIFTSNPLRSLDWLLEIWTGRIHNRVPGSELHIFSGAATYGKVGDAKNMEMTAILDMADSLSDHGIVLRQPLAKPELVGELRRSRVMLYRGDLNETFCLAVGEAQALGVPAVVQNLGSVGERVVDRKTGFVVPDDKSFAEAAIRLLEDDALWQSQHLAALESQRRWGWPQAAAAFEELI